VVFGSESAHAGRLVGAGQHCGPLLLVESFDFLGDGEVLVGDGPVGDAGIDQRHGDRLVAEEGGDRLEAHAAVDAVGGQGVPRLVGWTCPMPAAAAA
jgi:hypothetical protein